jgi:hypothetical protein
MKYRGLMVMVAAAITFSLAAATPGFSANDQAEQTTKKTPRHKRVAPPVQSPNYSARPFNSCDYDRAAGRCVIDLGYGRCMECSTGPFK